MAAWRVPGFDRRAAGARASSAARRRQCPLLGDLARGFAILALLLAPGACSVAADVIGEDNPEVYGVTPPPEASNSWFSRVAAEATKAPPTQSGALLEGLAPDRTGALYTGEVFSGQSTEPPASPPGPASAAALAGAPPAPPPPAPSQQAALPAYASAGPTGATPPQRMVSEDGAVVVDFSAAEGAPVFGSYLRPSGQSRPVALIYFADGSAALDGEARGVLREVVRMHREAGGLLRVVGHASARTETDDPLRRKIGNLRMSLARANAVAAALVGMGVEADRIQVAGAGDTELIYDESSPTGEAGNRRAEIYLDF